MPISIRQPAETLLLFRQLQSCPVTADQMKTNKLGPHPLLGVTICAARMPYRISCWGTHIILAQILMPRWMPLMREQSGGQTNLNAGGASWSSPYSWSHITWTPVWWIVIDKDIEKTERGCSKCQINQCLPQAPYVFQAWRWPTRPWAHLHVNFPGPIQGWMLSF